MPYQYLLTKSANGLAVHLSEAGSHDAICGVPITAAELQVPFALNGCRKCARVAVRRGTAWVMDVDGERVQLEV